MRKILSSHCWPVADKFPDAKIIGVDISPMQPNYRPENVDFVVDDISLDEWTYGGDYDLCYMRFVANSMKDCRGLLKRCFE